MKVIGRTALVAVLVVLGLLAGYAASLVFRTEAEQVPAIDLDRLPAGDAPPFEGPPEDGDIVVPHPTLAPPPLPPPTTLPPPPAAPAPPPPAPSPPPGDDEGSDDSPDDDGGDDGEFDDD